MSATEIAAIFGYAFFNGVLVLSEFLQYAFLLNEYGNTLEPPYKRPPYSGSVDGVLGCGA